MDALRALLAKPPAARSADAVAANLRVVGAELIQPVRVRLIAMITHMRMLFHAVLAWPHAVHLDGCSVQIAQPGAHLSLEN